MTCVFAGPLWSLSLVRYREKSCLCQFDNRYETVIDHGFLWSHTLAHSYKSSCSKHIFGVPFETLWVVRFCGLCVCVHAKGSSDVDPLIQIPRLSIQSLRFFLNSIESVPAIQWFICFWKATCHWFYYLYVLLVLFALLFSTISAVHFVTHERWYRKRRGFLHHGGVSTRTTCWHMANFPGGLKLHQPKNN